jgi:hypothetical protein
MIGDKPEITDKDNEEVIKFKAERAKKRESIKKDIRKTMLAKGFSEEQIKDFFETIYDTNGLIKKKYFLTWSDKSSPQALNVSLLLEDQRASFKTECERIQEEADKYIKETENQIKCVKGIVQLRKLKVFEEKSIKELENILYSQGPSERLMEKINKMLETSKYIDSLIKFIMRKEPSLKKYIEKIKAFILNAESEFRKKYKNTLAFNNADLSALKNASNPRELSIALPNLLK